MMKYFQITKDVGMEIVLRWQKKMVVYPIFVLDWTIHPKGTDHAGTYFYFNVWRFNFEFNIASCRHANAEDHNESKV